MNLDQIFAALWGIVGSPYLMGLILLAIPLGMFFGAVPGLGGRLGIVLLIRFVFGMDPTAGAVFLLAMHAVVHTGGSIPSILFGVPGTAPNAATLVDGFRMAQRGEAGRALGASLGASGVRGVIGAIFLAAMLPVLRPVVPAFSRRSSSAGALRHHLHRHAVGAQPHRSDRRRALRSDGRDCRPRPANRNPALHVRPALL